MKTERVRFALTGAAGFVAPRHMKAIQEVGGELIAVLDPHSSVGILDSLGFSKTEYFSAPEQFTRKLVKRQMEGTGIQYMGICSPNHLHDAHCRMALDLGADAICEKPLVVKPHNLDQLERYEELRGGRVHALLQMRYHPEALRIAVVGAQGFHRVELNYATPRGRWYLSTWKNRAEESGGLIANIGVHFLDLLISVFGSCERAYVHERTMDTVSGELVLKRASVGFYLTISSEGLRQRCLTVDGEPYDFTTGFEGLHTRVYEEVLAGRGFGISDARPSVELASKLQTMTIAGNLA